MPLFRKGFEKMSEAAIDRYNPELGSAMKKLKRAGADRDPMQAQKALSTLTTDERKAYMEAAGQQQGRRRAADEPPAAPGDGAHAEGQDARSAAEAREVTAS